MFIRGHNRVRFIGRYESFKQVEVSSTLIPSLSPSFVFTLQQGRRSLTFHLLKVPEDSVEHALLLLWGISLL
jgi:hypothetical protein